MEWVKTTAKTLPEAIDLALDNLGVDESDAEIVVLEEPRSGLFGRTKGTARVEARVKPKQSRPKQERRNKSGGRNKPRNDKSGRSDGGGGRNRSRGKSQDGDGQGRSQQNRSSQNNRADNNRADNNRADNDKAAAAPSNDQGGDKASGAQDGGGRSSGNGERNSRGQGGRSRGGRGNGGSGERGKRNSQNRSQNKTDAGPKVETPVEDVKNHLQEFLTGLTGAFDFEGPVTIDESPEHGLTGQIAGQHGLMVGPKGRTLDAIQELARISSSRKVPSSVRIKVDVGGYRAQRAVALGEFARKAADKAVENSVEVALDPMSAVDRKAVHDALSEDDRVETRSAGTDPRRKVIVVPVTAASDQDADDEDLVDATAGDSSEEE